MWVLWRQKEVPRVVDKHTTMMTTTIQVLHHTVSVVWRYKLWSKEQYQVFAVQRRPSRMWHLQKCCQSADILWTWSHYLHMYPNGKSRAKQLRSLRKNNLERETKWQHVEIAWENVCWWRRNDELDIQNGILSGTKWPAFQWLPRSVGVKGSQWYRSPAHTSFTPPPESTVAYSLRLCAHNLTLPDKQCALDSCNFVTRMLYANVIEFWLCNCYLILLSCHVRSCGLSSAW